MQPLSIGFASIYAWRPHVEHLAFLAQLAESAGHHVSFLACDGDLPTCYTRELRDIRPDWMECLLCRAGGIRSYRASGVSAIGELARAQPPLAQVSAETFAASSAATLGRFEAPEEYSSAEFMSLRDRLVPTVDLVYRAAREWIRRERLDAVCVFNGRIDATRAVFEAARDSDIRALTIERSWAGHGIQIMPDENCLGLRSIHRIVGQWRDCPLTSEQARLAAAPIAARITRSNTREWRAYNLLAEEVEWPVAGARRRLLLLPGSLNEIWGDANWASGWPEVTEAYDAILDHLDLDGRDVVLRCHPNWSEPIGGRDGSRPEAYYTRWARSRGIHLIASADRASTMSLIRDCEAVVLASGSAAVEAAAMGKQVISVAPSPYFASGICTDVTQPALISRLRLLVDEPRERRNAAEDTLRRMALRFSYTSAHRIPQYVRHVRAQSSWQFQYVPGADSSRFIELVRTGTLRADDEAFATDFAGEDEVITLMQKGRWSELAAGGSAEPAEGAPFRRRALFMPLDFVRARMKVGDR
ncbi:MAG: hypothetical protein Fur0019_14760 [Tibeticola sp.]